MTYVKIGTKFNLSGRAGNADFVSDHADTPDLVMEQVAREIAKFGLVVNSHETRGDFYAFSMYEIIRRYASGKRETVARHLTLEEAKEHCQDSETSSKSCVMAEGIARTEKFGPWFDGYDEM
jgi:hypothetical protein